jgi:hypothetical protein
MATHERSRTTTAAPARVWSVWSDVSTWPSWNPDVREISLQGPFATGTTGSMNTGAGTHDIRLENVVEGCAFDLVTSPIPATTFRFHCEVTPDGSGSTIKQGLTMSGLLAPIMSPLMGNRIAGSFEGILAGLARAVEG